MDRSLALLPRDYFKLKAPIISCPRPLLTCIIFLLFLYTHESHIVSLRRFSALGNIMASVHLATPPAPLALSTFISGQLAALALAASQHSLIYTYVANLYTLYRYLLGQCTWPPQWMRITLGQTSQRPGDSGGTFSSPPAKNLGSWIRIRRRPPCVRGKCHTAYCIWREPRHRVFSCLPS